MCGICGILGLEDANLLKSMMDTMPHRGPDESGTYKDTGIMLGHQRLSIIDLKSGKQAIHNEDETIWIIYNGEIYNFIQLKKTLEKKGHIFYTDSDTEVIVHLYEEYGSRCVEKLRGMFAFAIWDSKKKELFLARDRFGIKPLYYTRQEGVFYFASELKTLLEIPGLKRRIDPISLDNYLSLQYVPGPRTIIKDIKKIRPAHTLTVSKNKVEEERYWDLNTEVDEDQNINKISKKLIDLLKESVRLRLISEVPLGAFLSGGIDSSALVALMSQMTDEPVKTFSIGYGYEETDETGFARIVSDHLSTEHQEIILGPEEVLKELDKIVWHLDEPIADAALIAAYFLSKFTKKKVTVAFGGGGSDEVFAGYRAYKYSMMSETIRRNIPQPLRSLALGTIANTNTLPYRARKYMQYISQKEGEAFYEGQGILFSQEGKKGLYDKSFKKSIGDNNPNNIAKKNFNKINNDKKDFLNKLMYVDLNGWLPDLSLAQCDRMGMANSLEIRVPFLDHELVEYCNTIPMQYKINGWTEKYILRRTMKEYLPEQIINRPKKGFALPTDHWLYNTSSTLEDKNSLIRKNLNIKKVDAMLKSKGDFRLSGKLFGLLMLELWNKRYLEA